MCVVFFTFHPCTFNNETTLDLCAQDRSLKSSVISYNSSEMSVFPAAPQAKYVEGDWSCQKVGRLSSA